jgi:hypothetical protein
MNSLFELLELIPASRDYGSVTLMTLPVNISVT